MTRESTRFDGWVTLVTGAARGIGRATALGFASEGSTVVIVDREQEQGEAVAAEIRAHGGTAMAITVEATHDAEVIHAVERVINEWGQIDVLVNNIGVVEIRPFLETDETQWLRQLDLNLLVVLRFCRWVLPHMVERQFGRIVNIASIAAKQPRPNAVLYSAAKAGVVAVSRSLAVAMAPHNIRVNCICPGSIDTPAFRQDFSPEHIDNVLKNLVTLRRTGRPEEVAALVKFLASDDSSYILGQTVIVDGGNCMP